MSQYWEVDTFSQPTKQELKANARQTVKRAVNKGKQFDPIVTSGRRIANSWWGKAWCQNLERYADYASRIDRGKRYVRTGTVVDLKIKKGKVEARVQGSRKIPYKVEIRISPLSEERCQNIIRQCSSRLKNIEQLLNGNFPEDMKELFGGREGLFPTPKEISFSCSCPDWALMCKHVAAALYGIGVRFDENPLLFFELRGIDVDRFIDVTLSNRVEQMLTNAEHVDSQRIICDDMDVTNIFGLQM